MIKRTLEQRVTRLEKLLKISNRNTRRKFESFESDLDEAGARAKADQMAKEFSRVTGMADFSFDNVKDVISSPYYGWLGTDQVDEINEDPDSRFAFQYSNSKFTIYVIPTDNTIELLNDDGLTIDPSTGRKVNYDVDTPQDGAFPMSAWAKSKKIVGARSAKAISAKDREISKFIGAAYNFSPRVIAELIDNGADVNMQASDGTTALIAAIMQGNYQVVEYLLDHGADPNLANKRGWTPLKIANTYQKTHPHDIIGTLKSYGAHE